LGLAGSASKHTGPLVQNQAGPHSSAFSSRFFLFLGGKNKGPRNHAAAGWQHAGASCFRRQQLSLSMVSQLGCSSSCRYFTKEHHQKNPSKKKKEKKKTAHSDTQKFGFIWPRVPKKKHLGLSQFQPKRKFVNLGKQMNKNR